jgi:hypothetical protein
VSLTRGAADFGDQACLLALIEFEFRPRTGPIHQCRLDPFERTALAQSLHGGGPHAQRTDDLFFCLAFIAEQQDPRPGQLARGMSSLGQQVLEFIAFRFGQLYPVLDHDWLQQKILLEPWTLKYPSQFPSAHSNIRFCWLDY